MPMRMPMGRSRVSRADLGGVGNTPWTPAALGSALVSWWDTSDATTLTLNGGAIAAVADKSGNGNHIVQATGANQPAYSATGINNVPAAVYSGAANLFLATPGSFVVNQPMTVVSLFKTGASLSSTPAVWDGSAAATGASRAILFDTRSDLSGQYAIYAGTLIGLGANLSASTPYLSSAQLSGASSLHGLNGEFPSPVGSPSLSVFNPGVSGVASGFRWGGTTPNFAGAIGFSVIVNRLLTNDERQKIEGYAAWRFGLQHTVLASNHPFYNAAPTTAAVPTILYNTTNIDAAHFPSWRAARAKVLNGTGRATILVVGDSTSMGYGAGSGGTADTNARIASVPAQIAAGLAARGIPTSIDSWTGTANEFGNTLYDPRVTFGAGWASLAGNYLGSPIAHSAGATTQHTFAPANAFDKIEVYYIDNKGSGAFDTSIDAGASLGSTTIGTGTAIIRKAVFTVPLGTHTVKITPSAGSDIWLYGIKCYNSAVPAIDILIGAFGGATSGNWSDASLPYTSINAIKFFAPDLTIVNLGINDENTSVPAATFQANIQPIYDAGKVSGDVFLSMHTPTNGAGAGLQPSYEAAYNTLASSNNAPLIDLFQRYLSYAAVNGRGWMFDTLHPNATPYAQIGDYEAQILASV